VGAPKVVRLLRDGGTVCLFWNFEDLDAATEAVLDDVYGRHAPELLEDERAGKEGSHAKALRATGCFTQVREQTYRYDETLPKDEWIARISTYSRNLLLGPRLPAVQHALTAQLPETVQLRSGTYAVWAKP
jgi:hypothetical protein